MPRQHQARDRGQRRARRIEGRWDRAFRASELGSRLSCCLCVVAGRAAKCLITVLRVELHDGGLWSFRCVPHINYGSGQVLLPFTPLCYCQSSLLHCSQRHVTSSGTLFTQPMSTELRLKMHRRVHVGLEKRLHVLCCRHAECRHTCDRHSVLY